MNYYIPQWEERTSYGFRRIDPYAKLFEERIIYLGTPISDDVANAGQVADQGRPAHNKD